MPRQSGVATRNTTTLAGRSAFRLSISDGLMLDSSRAASLVAPDENMQSAHISKLRNVDEHLENIYATTHDRVPPRRPHREA